VGKKVTPPGKKGKGTLGPTGGVGGQLGSFGEDVVVVVGLEEAARKMRESRNGQTTRMRGRKEEKYERGW
jgi:hypothetical protein